MGVPPDYLKDVETLIIETIFRTVSQNLVTVEPRQMYSLYLYKCFEHRRISEGEVQPGSCTCVSKAIVGAVKDNIFMGKGKGQIEQLWENLSLREKTWKKI